MEKYFPESPKIKYIIPKVIPTSFSLTGESLDDLEEKEENKINSDNDSESELEECDLDLNNNNNEKCMNRSNSNSIYFTLINLKKRSESNSSIDTKDSL